MAININPAHKGKLHKALDVPAGKPIPGGMLEKATHSSKPAVKKEAVFAKNANGFNRVGRHGGIIGKTDPGKNSHSTAPVTSVATDRGGFKIKG
jgi:hypothetical protein